MTQGAELLRYNNSQPLLMRVVATKKSWYEARSIAVSKRKRGYLAHQVWSSRGWLVCVAYPRQRAPRRCDLA